MSRHVEKVLAHAERQLAPTGAKRPTDVLPFYKKFLKIEEHRLRLKHQAGGGGRDICARRSELVDVLLRHVFEAATAFTIAQRPDSAVPLTLIALGGYGRGELNPFSDVDVMFLHAKSGAAVSPYVSEVVEQILYLLWDIGFKVGHSTRSITEAIAEANREMRTKTSMLESRYLAGAPKLAELFREQFRLKCVKAFERQYVELRMRDQAERHAKFGDSVYMQEPHVKNGCGGLRDYQNLLWMTFFKEGALTTTHLVGKNWLSPSDQRHIDAAYDFLLRVRNDLHYANGRGTDILHLNLQEEIARRLHYRPSRGVHRSEALMKEYFEHTRNVFRVTERITEQFASGGSSGALRLLLSFLPLAKSEVEEFENFFSRLGQLHVEKPNLFLNDPPQMMRAFQLTQERYVDLSPELEDLFTRSLGLVTRTFQYAKEPREMFKSILSRKGEVGRVLRMMHRVDFLGRYLPEFGQLTCLVQHEFFHRYTADEHTLVCIDKLDALATTEDTKLMPYRKLFEKLDDPFVLYLALLLHDTGKGIAARPHSEASALFAQRVATRLQLPASQRKALILLVDHHVSLSAIAQQRNLDDPATIVEFARSIKDQANLDALMLLTLADSQGTSAKAWTDWKQLLVWQLYHSTTRYLADQEAFHRQMRIEREKLFVAVCAELPDDSVEEAEAHFDFMPDNYFRAFAVREIASHVKLVREFLWNLYGPSPAPLAPAFHWEPVPAKGHSVASICAWDRRQLLAKIAGSFATVPINILSADIYTRGDNLVLDAFHVCSATSEAVVDRNDMAQVEVTLRAALEHEHFDFTPLLEKARRQHVYRANRALDFPTRITLDSQSHPTYTLIEIETPDRLGLLYDLLSCLVRERVYIAFSRINTEKGAAIDTFYVADSAKGGKITDPDRAELLQKRLQEAALS
ncbi:MAG: [protein-PII] uridylyltransferase [Verrucomicrobiota bacterium]|jgi:[protein-PII] uridylyltransferase